MEVTLPVPARVFHSTECAGNIQPFLLEDAKKQYICALGRPLRCKVINPPGPLKLLATLHASFLRARWQLPQAQEKCQSAIGAFERGQSVQSGAFEDFWNRVPRASFETAELLVCDASDVSLISEAMNLPTVAMPNIAIGQSLPPPVPTAPLISNALGKRTVVQGGEPRLHFIHASGTAASYRVECIRIGQAKVDGGERQKIRSQLSPSSLFLPGVILKSLSGDASVGEEADVVLRVECIPPGRYEFRVQACSANGTYGAFSPVSRNNCLVPADAVRVRCLKILEAAMTQHKCACNSVKCHCQTPEIAKSIELALDSGADEEDPIIVQATDLLQVLGRQPVRPYEVDQKCQGALKELKQEALLKYRPKLEKALFKAHAAGIPEDADEVQNALGLLTVLRKKEHRKKKTVAEKQKAIDQCLNQLNHQMEVNFRMGIMKAIENAKFAGVPENHPMMQMAKRKCAQLEPKRNEDEVPSGQDQELTTEVVKATIASKEKLLKSVIQLKGSPNSCDKDGRSVLLVAASTCSFPCIKVLLDAKAHMNVRDAHGNTPLMASLLQSNTYDNRIAQVLLERDCHPGQQNVFGRAPLHEAAASQSDVVVKLLLERKARPDVADNMGVQPLYLAKTASGSKSKGSGSAQRCVDLLNTAMAAQDQDQNGDFEEDTGKDEKEDSEPSTPEEDEEEDGDEGSIDGFNPGMDDDQMSMKSMITTAATTPERGVTPTPGKES